MVITALIQIANFSVQPLLALYVGDMTQSDNIAFLSGLAFSATGFGNLVMTRKWGQLGDKYGYEKILNILLIMAAVLLFHRHSRRIFGCSSSSAFYSGLRLVVWCHVRQLIFGLRRLVLCKAKCLAIIKVLAF